MRKFKTLHCSFFSPEESGEKIDKFKVNAIDTLLFECALKGRVPAFEPEYRWYADVRTLLNCHFWYADFYYIGRAKAMKCYKQNEYEKYYLEDRKCYFSNQIN